MRFRALHIDAIGGPIGLKIRGPEERRLDLAAFARHRVSSAVRAAENEFDDPLLGIVVDPHDALGRMVLVQAGEAHDYADLGVRSLLIILVCAREGARAALVEAMPCSVAWFARWGDSEWSALIAFGGVLLSTRASRDLHSRDLVHREEWR
jgi:hypothetical protein